MAASPEPNVLPPKEQDLSWKLPPGLDHSTALAPLPHPKLGGVLVMVICGREHSYVLFSTDWHAPVETSMTSSGPVHTADSGVAGAKENDGMSASE